MATGDFRYTPSILNNINFEKNQIDICYLDNTYFNPVFSKAPSRDEALRQIILIIDQHRSANVIFKLLLKNLGKERLLVDLVEYYRIPIVVSHKRFERLTKILEIDKKYFTSELSQTSLIFVDDEPINKVGDIFVKKKVIYIEPTGLKINNSEAKCETNYFRVPYSDHSSYTEIITFVKKIHPKKIIPIVRKLLPNEIDTTDMSSLEKFLNKDPITDSSHKYSLLLQSTSSTRKSSRLNSINLNKSKNRVPTPITSRFITLRNTSKTNKEPQKSIEYETPRKQTPKRLSSKISFVSSPKRSVQFLKKSSNPSKMVNTLLEPISEESRNEIFFQVDSENENQGMSKPKNKQHSLSNKENWRKINNNMELLISSESDESIFNEKNISNLIETTVEGESIVKRNPVVILEKMDSSKYRNIQTDQQNEKEGVSSDESIYIEKTIRDKLDDNCCTIDTDYLDDSLNDEIDINSSKNNQNNSFFESMNKELENYSIDLSKIHEKIHIHILDSFEF